jgi:hypothetical protein
MSGTATKAETVKIGQIQGPLGKTPYSFNVHQKTVALIQISGTVWANSVGTAGFNVLLDGDPIGNTVAWFNQTASHMTVPTMSAQQDLDAGSHRITLTPLDSNTNSDQNDHYNITVSFLS